MISGLVTTIIPVYNRPKMLRDAVQSVLSQTHRPIEVVISDDGSTDETWMIAEELSSAHPGVIFADCHKHSGRGPGPMRESGRKHARGEFIQYLDSDDRLLPNKFADQVAVLRKHPECDIAYGMTRLVDADGKVLAEPFKWTGRNMPSLFPGLLVDRWWCTHTPLYRRSLTDRLGPWSEMRWSQDWEYDARAGGMCVRIVSCQSYVSEHVHHSGVRQTSAADWDADPERLRNRLDLLRALWVNAQRANVPPTSEERQHFARWCFKVARNCAAGGLCSEAEELLFIAAEAGRWAHGGRGVWQFHMLARMCGYPTAGKIARWLERGRRGVGRSTLEQSFSGQM